MKQPEQPTDKFLAGCRLSSDTPAAKLALEVRGVLAEWCSPPRDPNTIFCGHRIATDVGISDAESLDLVDLSLTLESTLGVGLDDDNLLKIYEMQKSNCTVANYVAFLLGIAKEGKS